MNFIAGILEAKVLLQHLSSENKICCSDTKFSFRKGNELNKERNSNDWGAFSCSSGIMKLLIRDKPALCLGQGVLAMILCKETKITMPKTFMLQPKILLLLLLLLLFNHCGTCRRAAHQVQSSSLHLARTLSKVFFHSDERSESESPAV